MAPPSADVTARDGEQHGDQQFESGGTLRLATTGTGLVSSAELEDILGPLKVTAGIQGCHNNHEKHHQGSSPLPSRSSGVTHGVMGRSRAAAAAEHQQTSPVSSNPPWPRSLWRVLGCNRSPAPIIICLDSKWAKYLPGVSCSCYM